MNETLLGAQSSAHDAIVEHQVKDDRKKSACTVYTIIAFLENEQNNECTHSERRSKPILNLNIFTIQFNDFY